MWNSSQRINNDFLVNYKAIHSYLCSGMLPRQYQKYSTFLNIGLHKKGFQNGAVEVYSNVVEEIKQKSISNASELEQTQSLGDAEGIAIMMLVTHVEKIASTVTFWPLELRRTKLWPMSMSQKMTKENVRHTG